MGSEVNGSSGNQLTWIGWQNYCAGLNRILPLLGNVVYNNPMPWVQNYFQQQWFPGASNGLLTSDQIQINYAPTGTGGGGGDGNTVKPDPNDELTAEERLKQNQEAAQKRAEISKLVDNHTKMYNLLKNYGESLTDKTDPTKTVFMETLKSYENKAKSNMTKEKLEKAVADIKAMYDLYADKIKTHTKTEAQKDVTSTTNTTYATNVTTLNNGITNGNDKTFGVLTTDTPAKWNDEVDILELISTWNSTDTLKSTHIPRTILDKYKATTGEQKSNYEALLREFQNKLISVAEDIDESKLSDETKNALTGAITQLKLFDSTAKRAININNYSHSFDNLYRAIRLAKAEIADDEMKDQFDFLGDQNPYKNGTFLADVKTDLHAEGCENAYDEVTAPQTSLTVKQQIQARTANTVSTIKSSDGTKIAYIYSTPDGKTLLIADNDGKEKSWEEARKELEITGWSVSAYSKNGNGEYMLYKGEKDNPTEAKYFNADGNEISKEDCDGK